MVKFRITVARSFPLLAVCLLLPACREAAARTELTFPGRNPMAAIAESGQHVVYVDPETKRLMHRGEGSAKADPVSPASVELDLRGENSPLLAARPDGTLLVIYPTKLGMNTKGKHSHAFGELTAQISKDNGRTWSAPRRIDGDDGQRGHNFADLATRPDGDVVVSWLDSRAGKQGVQTTVLKSDLSVAPAQTVDPLTCQCCRTALFATSKGDVWLAYRDLADNKVRNMAYAVSGPGKPFEPRGDVVNDNWKIDGCPESGPRFAETTDGAIWLAWFNGGANTIETAASTGTGFEPRGPAASGAVNHPDLGTLPDGRLIVVYESIRDGKRFVEARVSDAEHARWSNPKTLAADASTPRYTRRGDRTAVTYITQVEGTPYVHVMDPLPAIEGDSP